LYAISIPENTVPGLRSDPSRRLVARPFIPVSLHGLSRSTSPYYALLDSGADSVLFPADLAEAINLGYIATGRFERAMGIAGQTAEIYYHNVRIQVLGDSKKLPIEVGFSHHLLIPILGRTFFRHFRAIVFKEEKEAVELKR
jgi:predicted aspartyl protease